MRTKLGIKYAEQDDESTYTTYDYLPGAVHRLQELGEHHAAKTVQEEYVGFMDDMQALDPMDILMALEEFNHEDA